MWRTIGISVLVGIVLLVVLAVLSRFGHNPLDMLSAPAPTPSASGGAASQTTAQTAP